MEANDQSALCFQLGRIARRSSSALNEDLCDLSELLSKTDLEEITDPQQMPECGLKEWLIVYLESHKFQKVTWQTTPRERINILKHREVHTQADVLIATTIVTPIIDKFWRDHKILWKDDLFDLKPDQLTEFVIWWGDMCAVTIDHMTFPLIKGLTYLAERLSIEIIGGRNNNGAPDDFETRAYDPTLEVRYEVLRHIPRMCVLDQIRMPLTPFENLARWISDKPCTIAGPLIFKETNFLTACEELASIFWTTQSKIESGRIKKSTARNIDPPRQGKTNKTPTLE